MSRKKRKSPKATTTASWAQRNPRLFRGYLIAVGVMWFLSLTGEAEVIGLALLMSLAIVFMRRPRAKPKPESGLVNKYPPARKPSTNRAPPAKRIPQASWPERARRAAEKLTADAEAPPPSDHSSYADTAHASLPKAPASTRVSLKTLLAMTPTDFEGFCGQALTQLGYRNVHRVGGAGDLMADLQAEDTHGRSTIVQCKRYRPEARLGSPLVQTFIGMKTVHHQAERGIIMTTADYSQPAIRLADQHDIILIDGRDLVNLSSLLHARDRLPPPTMLPVNARSGQFAAFCSGCGHQFQGDDDRFCSGCGSQRKAVKSS